MFWLAIPIVVAGKILYDSITKEDSPLPTKKTTLELNFDRLTRELRLESGKKIAIIGQPGSGKSSLLNKITKGGVIPIPHIGNETDATDWSSDTNCNLLSHYNGNVFADVPGYDTKKHPCGVFISSFPFREFDYIIFVIRGKLHSADEAILKGATKTNTQICIARSFFDSLEKKDIEAAENDIRNRIASNLSFDFVFFSNKTGKGINKIFQKINSL